MRFVSRRFSTLPAAESLMRFQLDGSLVSVCDVTKTFVRVLLRPLQTLPLVLLAYHLAIRAPAEGPPEGRPAAQNGGERQSEAFCSEEGIEVAFTGGETFAMQPLPLARAREPVLRYRASILAIPCRVALSPSS